MFFYYNNSYLRETGEDDLYPLNREALDEAAMNEGIDGINWEKWDEHVNKVQHDIKKALKRYKKPHKGCRPPVSIVQYDKNGLKVREYEKIIDVVKRGFSPGGVSNAIRTGKLYRNKYYFKKKNEK